MATAMSEIDEIRQRMAKIRRDLHADVQGVVEGAAVATSWRHFVKTYPWPSVAVSLAIGYLVVPKRRKKPVAITIAPTDLSLDGDTKTVVVERLVQAPEKPKRSLVMTVAGWAAPLAWRAFQGYGMQFLTKWVEQQQASLQRFAPQPGAAPRPGAIFSPSGYPGNPGEARR